MPYRSTKFQENTLSPAFVSSVDCDTSAVEPKPSAGTVPLTIVGVRRVLAKFVAASFESIARSSSLPPATFAPFDGTMNGSPAVECIASYGSDELELTVGSGAPVILKPAFVCLFISFSIQDPEGYSRPSSSFDHCACAAVNCVPAPPGLNMPASMIFFIAVNTDWMAGLDQHFGSRFSSARRTSSPPSLIADAMASVW